MNLRTLFERYLTAKPTIKMVVDWPIIIGTGLLGEIFSWGHLPLSPYSNFFGGAIFLGGWLFHQYCHRAHKQAHEQPAQIDHLVTTGVFATIRHPMYLSLILMYLGTAIAWGISWMLIPSLCFAVLTIFSALKEEAFLLEKFGSQYERYMQTVPWRFIPKIF